MAQLSILSVGKGDHRIQVETDEDVKTLGPTIKSLLKSGYLITTDSGEKVTDYNDEKGMYIVAGRPEGADPKQEGATAVAPTAGG